MAIATYDPIAANGSAEAAWADQRAHRASPTHHVGWETPAHDIHCIGISRSRSNRPPIQDRNGLFHVKNII
jgi:hypothetical protein